MSQVGWYPRGSFPFSEEKGRENWGGFTRARLGGEDLRLGCKVNKNINYWRKERALCWGLCLQSGGHFSWKGRASGWGVRCKGSEAEAPGLRSWLSSCRMGTIIPSICKVGCCCVTGLVCWEGLRTAPSTLWEPDLKWNHRVNLWCWKCLGGHPGMHASPYVNTAIFSLSICPLAVCDWGLSRELMFSDNPVLHRYPCCLSTVTSTDYSQTPVVFFSSLTEQSP